MARVGDLGNGDEAAPRPEGRPFLSLMGKELMLGQGEFEGDPSASGLVP